MLISSESGAAEATVTFDVTLHTSSVDINDFQFDLYYDASALSYDNGPTTGYTRGTLITDWSMVSDSVVEAGHLRFGGLDLSTPIAANSNDVLLHIIFTVTCEGCLNNAEFAMNLDAADGSITGYTLTDGTFTFTAE